jgi:RND family efflux transporter MFP subunit
MAHVAINNERTFAPRWLGSILAAALTVGCGAREEAAPPPRTKPHVRIVRPERRTIERTVGQPAFINAFEQTSMYPKIAGYIKKWTVDIGDRITKDQVMAELFVPELDAEYEQKKAIVRQDEASIEAARQSVKVAQNTLNVATAQVKKAEADVGSYESAVERWESEVKRLTGLVGQQVVDKQVLDESQKQLKSNVSQRDAARASVAAAQADEMARRADLDKAVVDVDVAEAKANVSRAEEQRYAALVSYTRLTAPYDGVVVVRNANTGDFVQPAGGDRSVERGAADLSAGHGAPIYIVARTDIVRVFVDVPEIDANHVVDGTPGRVQIQALDDAEIKGNVTRTSWSLNVQTRTLRAEIDLPNPDARLLPGMYAYGMLDIKRSNVFAVPLAAVIASGNENCCFLLEDGRAVKTPVQAGINDGRWIEVSKQRVNGTWTSLTGDEQVVLGDLAALTDGEAVEVESGKASSED